MNFFSIRIVCLKSHCNTTSHPLDRFVIEKQKITSVSENVEQLEPSYNTDGKVNGVAALENSLPVANYQVLDI